MNKTSEILPQRPDLIICDEAHNLKNLTASCTRRVARFMDKYPETKFVVMSGTLIKNSLKDFAHLDGYYSEEVDFDE